MRDDLEEVHCQQVHLKDMEAHLLVMAQGSPDADMGNQQDELEICRAIKTIAGTTSQPNLDGVNC